MFFKQFFLLSFICSLSFLSTLIAEKAPMSPAALKKAATHVVTGKILAIYQRIETIEKWKYTRYLTEIQVYECEKGEGIQKGQLIYARYWKRKFIGLIPPPSTYGHNPLPTQGEFYRVYLAKNAYDGFTKDNKDSGFNVIGANGFEKASLAPKTTQQKSILGKLVLERSQLPEGCSLKNISKEDFIPFDKNPFLSTKKEMISFFAVNAFKKEAQDKKISEILFLVGEEKEKLFGLFGFQFDSEVEAKFALDNVLEQIKKEINITPFQKKNILVLFCDNGITNESKEQICKLIEKELE